jgi:hypothetical protein
MRLFCGISGFVKLGADTKAVSPSLLPGRDVGWGNAADNEYGQVLWQNRFLRLDHLWSTGFGREKL